MPENRLFTEKATPSEGGEVSPLDDERARTLLPRVGVIRDPLHGDIRITALERSLIDMPAFQRLRHVSQLAMVDLVYPGATHNRFLHSIGTLHVCSEMIAACNNSTKLVGFLAASEHPIPLRIGYYAELVARLVALLHDTAHIPFGHVFEREAQVFEHDEWQDDWRIGRTLDADADFGLAIRTFFALHFSAHADARLRLNERDADTKAGVLLKDIVSVLTAKGSMIFDLRYPFIYDLVGNTICADLIDYVQRDMYFCGLTEGLGKRFIQYLAVLPVQCSPDESASDSFVMQPVRLPGEDIVAPENDAIPKERTLCRLVLMQYRYNSRRAPSAKGYILGEAIDLIRRRKQVAERLYFHKTKLMATSMLAAAAHASGVTSAEAIWDMSDTEVLKAIATGSISLKKAKKASGTNDDQNRRRSARARKLGNNLLRRELFKPIYRAEYYPPEREDDHSRRLWSAYEEFSDPSGREALITGLERTIELTLNRSVDEVAGAVSISCPNRDMQLKGFEMLVLSRPDKPKLEPLQQTVHPTVSEEIHVIQRGHEELWRLEVFVDPRIVDLAGPLANTLSAIVCDAVGLPNELPEFSTVRAQALDVVLRQLWLDSELGSMELRKEIKEVHYQELCHSLGDSRDDARTLQDRLREWGYKIP